MKYRAFRLVWRLVCLSLLLTIAVVVPASAATVVYSSGNVAVPIPDNDTTGASVTINVPDTGPVTDVNVRVRLNHTNDSDLAIGLSHSNSGNALSNNNGGTGDNYGSGNNDCSGTKTVFDDEAATAISAGTAPFAGAFQPQSGLSLHDGAQKLGSWTVTVVDSVAGGTGTIGCVELEITATDPAVIQIPTLSSGGLTMLILLLAVAGISIIGLLRQR